MIRVYFESTNGYVELVAIFQDGELYCQCFDALEKEAKNRGFALVTESVDESKTIEEL